jgi:hypothetical protein
MLILSGFLLVRSATAQTAPQFDAAASRAAYERELAAGRAADLAGSARDALRYYVSAHDQSEALTDPEVDSLRALIFRTAASLRPPPALPDSAMIYEVRAQARFDAAKNPGDLSRAAREFEHATRVAPWVGRFYYNVALIREQLGDLDNLRLAARLIRQYLASGEGDDRDAVRRKLIALEVQIEQQLSPIEYWVGEWTTYSNFGSSSEIDGPCRLTERHCATIGREFAGHTGGPWQFVGFGTRIDRRQDTLFITTEAGSRPVTWFGIARGPNIQDVEWFMVWDVPSEWRHCEGFIPSGVYPARATVVARPDGTKQLQLTNYARRVEPRCALVERSEYMTALGPPRR